MQRAALVISGGGSKGAFAVGAVEVLRTHFDFRVIAGTSTGALIAPMVAIDDYEHLSNLYTTVKTSDILRNNWRKLWLNAVQDTKPLENLVRETLDTGNRYKKIMESEREILLCSVGFQSKAIKYYSQRGVIPGSLPWRDKEGMIKAVLASTNQPVYMPLIEIDGEQHADGGVKEIVPIRIIEKTDLKRVIVIVNHPEKSVPSDSTYNNCATIGLRALSVMTNEIGHNDVKPVIEYHKLLAHLKSAERKAADLLTVAQLQTVFGDEYLNREPLEITLIRPKDPLPSDGLSFDPDVMKLMRDIGQQRAREILEVE